MNLKLFIFSILLFTICLTSIQTQTTNQETDQLNQIKAVVDTYIRENLPDKQTKELFANAELKDMEYTDKLISVEYNLKDGKIGLVEVSVSDEGDFENIKVEIKEVSPVNQEKLINEQTSVSEPEIIKNSLEETVEQPQLEHLNESFSQQEIPIEQNPIEETKTLEEVPVVPIEHEVVDANEFIIEPQIIDAPNNEEIALEPLTSEENQIFIEEEIKNLTNQNENGVNISEEITLTQTNTSNELNAESNSTVFHETPVESVDPVETIETVEPEVPEEPAEPIEITQPVEPVEPVESIEPIEPVEITEHVEPVEPIEPIEPEVPVNPEVYPTFPPILPPHDSYPPSTYFNPYLGLIPVSYSSSRDTNCARWSTTSCIRCFDGFYLSSTGTCEYVDNNCLSYNPYSGECFRCAGGFTVRGNKCLPVDPNCLYFDPLGRCLNCRQGYEPVQGVCQNVHFSIAQVYNCLSYNGVRCLQCEESYFVGAYGECTRIDFNCERFDNLTKLCFECKKGYVPSGASCLLIW